jgi:hypothetical protein
MMLKDVVNFIGGLIPMGCSSSSELEPHTGVQKDAGADAETSMEAGADVSVETGQDAKPESSVDASLDAAQDAEGGAIEDADAAPATPNAPGVSVYSPAPCAFPASLTYNPADDRLYMSCGGAQNALWRSPTMGTSGAWGIAGTAGGYPSNHAMIDDRYAVIAHSMPDGFTIIDTVTNTVSQQVNFSNLNILDESNNSLPFTPNSPSGIVVAGGTIYIATNNIDTADFSHPENTTFHPGTLIAFHFNGNGTIDTGSAKAHITSCLNPTGTAKIDDATIAVLSSGSYDPATTEAELEICTLPAFDCTATQLGNLTAQTSPVMPITASGLILVGIQKPTNRIVGIDIATNAIAMDRAMPDIENFISNIASYDDVAVVNDFGSFGVGSAILFAHTNPAGWGGIPITPLPWGSTGPAVIVGDALYVATTSNDGMEGRVSKVNMSGME